MVETNERKRVLILTVTAGNAHNSCARAMKRVLDAVSDAEVLIADLFAPAAPLSAWITDRGYNLAVGRLLPLYNLFYRRYERLPPEKRYVNGTQTICLSAVRSLLQTMLEFRPDVVYCTQYNCAVAACDLKLAYGLPCRIVTTCLDYTIGPFWESAVGVDAFVIPHESFIGDALKKGFRREQLLPVGLPVDIRTGGLSRETIDVRQDPDTVLTVLIMYGGGNWRGVYPIFRMTVRALAKKKAHLVVICGRDRRSHGRIAKKSYPGLEIETVGFTDDLPSYLARADVIINKCGGASTAEMLNAAKPLVIYEKLPEQEKHNLLFLKRNGAAVSFRSQKDLTFHLGRLLELPALRKKMSENALPLRRNPIAEVAQRILSAPKADWEPVLLQKPDVRQAKRTTKRALKAAHRAEKDR